MKDIGGLPLIFQAAARYLLPVVVQFAR